MSRPLTDNESLSLIIKRRQLAPISVRYDPPGPGRYIHYTLTGYKGHDSSKFREPAYTMRPITFLNRFFTPGPGPAVYQDRRQTYRGMYNSPAYTMRCFCAPKPPFLTPGPPTYRYENYPPYLESRAPVYTMAARTRYPLHFLTPAPNLYRMPEVMGRGQAFFPDDPGYTMPGYNEQWSFHRDYHRTPGPAAHDPTHPNTYRNRSPIYTMRPQIYVRPLFMTPAPNAYRAEDVTMHKPTIFKKTFGVKHSVFVGAMINKVTSQCRMVPKLRKEITRFC